MHPLNRLRAQARQLKCDTYAVYLALRDPRVPWYTRALAAVVAGYALSPLDLVPDIIPVLGYLDDLILVPLGIALVLRLLPAEVLADCRVRAAETLDSGALNTQAARLATAIIVAIWLLLAALGLSLLARAFTR